MASLIKQNGWFYLQFYNSNRQPSRKRIPLKTRTKRKAEEIRHTLEASFADGSYDPWFDQWHSSSREDPIPLLKDALQRYLRVKTAEDWRRVTAENNAYILGSFIEYCGPKQPVEHLSTEPVNKFLNQDRLAYETKRTHKKRIMAFLRWLIKNKYTTRSFEEVKIYNRDHEQAEGINYLSPEEIEKLIQAIRKKVASDIKNGYQNRDRNSQWLIDLIKWQRYSGMRISETLNLRARDVDTHTWEIRIGSEYFSTKTKAKQVLPIAEVTPLKQIVVKLLNQCRCESADRLFGHTDRRRTSRTFKKYLRLALPEREEITLHSLRHTCCIELLKAGVSIYKVQRWMRHSDLRTTQRYVDVLNLDLSRTIGEVFTS